jgi:flavin-dependent dehydrogenase
MVMRSRFDAFLLAQAGVEVWTQAPVTAVTENRDSVKVIVRGRQLTARYLVGADGATSCVARQLGLRRNRQLGGSLEAEVQLSGRPELRSKFGNRAVFAFGVIPWGYAWSFPKKDHLSVGIGRVRPGKVDLPSALGREMARMGIPLDGVAFHGHPLPCYQAPPWPFWRETGWLRPGNRNRHPQEPLSTRRSLLVGDAAGLVDPLIGEGIRYAIASARLAAEAIVQDDLSIYESKIWREIGHSLATAGLTANTYYRLPRFGFRVGLRNPTTVRHLIDVITGRTSYQGIGRRVLADTVRWRRDGHTTPDT